MDVLWWYSVAGRGISGNENTMNSYFKLCSIEIFTRKKMKFNNIKCDWDTAAETEIRTQITSAQPGHSERSNQTRKAASIRQINLRPHNQVRRVCNCTIMYTIMYTSFKKCNVSNRKCLGEPQSCLEKFSPPQFSTKSNKLSWRCKNYLVDWNSDTFDLIQH